MENHTFAERVRGCVLGQALGDALGAPFEFQGPEVVRARTGGEWIDGLYPVEIGPGPHGPWRSPAPAGTGTDDTRYLCVFLELATEAGRLPTSGELARRFLDIYERPRDFFPGFAELARGQFEMWEGACRGHLGQASSLYPGVPPQVLRERSVGLNYPTMAGLLALTSAGLLFAGEPERAYRAVFETAFFDVAYGREATALFAAALALAAGGRVSVEEVVGRVLDMDPLRLGGYFGGPFVKEHLPEVLEEARGRQGEELAAHLSRTLHAYGVFDPFRALAVVFAALLAHADEPLQALLVAANQRDADAQGRWARCADIDCYAGIAGALAGALCGASAFPGKWLEQVVESNREVYGLDLEARAGRFCARFAG